MPDLLFQRQDDDFEIKWAGRAGDYLNHSLALMAERFPARHPDPDELAGAGQREPRSTGKHMTWQIAREQRVARGLCLDCPNTVGESDTLRCRPCREAVAEKERTRKDSRDQRLGRCSRCHRRPRSAGCALLCRLCWNSADRTEGAA